MHDSEQRIRERAYAIWEQEGRPHGRQHIHWERARLLVEMEAGAIQAERREGPVPSGDGRGDATVADDRKSRAPRQAKVAGPASRTKASAAPPRRNAKDEAARARE